VEEARQLGERSLATVQRLGERGTCAWGLRHLGEVAARSEPAALETSENRYRGALALAEDLGMRPLVAHCHFGLGTLYQRSGRRDQSQEHLTAAAAMYREMDMRSWLDRTDKGGVPRVTP
jgi:hypothetical protein